MSKSMAWGIASVIGCTIIYLPVGYYETNGNMIPYLKEILNISSSEAIWINTVLISCLALTMPIGGILYSKFGFRYITLGSIILCSGGIMLSKFTVTVGFVPFIITYSVVHGSGVGLSYSILYVVASGWFPAHRALVVGIVNAGLGLSALVFTPIQAALINPDNLADFSNPTIIGRIPDALLIIGGIQLCIQVVGIAMTRENKSDEMTDIWEPTISKEQIDDKIWEDIEDAPESLNTHDRDEEILEDVDATSESLKSQQIDEGILENIEDNLNTSEKLSQIRNYTVREALKTIDFYLLLFITSNLNGIVANLFNATYKIYGKEMCNDDKYLTTVSTVVSVFTAVGKILWGLVVDKFSFKCPLGWDLCQFTILFTTFPLLSFGTSKMFQILYPIWVLGIYISISGKTSIIPSATLRIFGPKYMATIFGLIQISMIPPSILLSAILSQFNINGKWLQVYLSCAALTAFGFILSLFLRDRDGTCIACSDNCAISCNRCRSNFEDDTKSVSTSA